MADAPPLTEAFYREWFAKQTVFLTGATGGLGGCLLFKLLHQVPVKKVFLLHRSSEKDTIAKLGKNMPGCIDQVMRTDQLEFLKGDITAANLGLDVRQLSILRKETTVILNAAANTSFIADVHESCKDNCLPALDLAQLALSFPQLATFVQVSSAYANSFLPDGEITETIQPFGEDDIDCERELDEILSSRGNTSWTKQWAWPYAQAKYLMERLLFQRYGSRLPLLILLPSAIGPALQDPYPLFGPAGSNPVETALGSYLATGGGSRVWRAASGSTSGNYILDGIPVDFVSNVCLLHVAQGSQGIIHAAAQLYVVLTMDELMALASPHIPPDLAVPAPCFKWDVSGSMEPCPVATTFGFQGRNWIFDCRRSKSLRAVGGPLSLSLDGHDAKAYIKGRIEKIIPSTRATKKRVAARRRGMSKL
ncbi:hypothetical protein BO86DRAFT_370871 [Aspergillus japonicus CBS 114.51]|uniref:Fatty acyl-CoA reductase n=1 Tax=Aspergillus japonicus CBS 114.51 TaxID=1448312 RepID=A0A8T8WP60_ASPJA|nr:hypothetical protein BO86DRAFT_370871 [Aspergillus japonicus CBS 114.51]RAH77430.1 hypothetical protein BO86DRAFT_370871 [Aspergillus japonicus CBS 114.51]